MNIAPLTSMLESVRKQTLPWWIILCELVDNAFDAGAKRVQISFDHKQLVIADDGDGCDELNLMLTMGGHRRKPTTKLGIYGIGAKDAIISAADSVSIVSVHRGIKRQVLCDWKKIEKTGSWEVEDPVAAPTNESMGTRIILYPLRSDRLKNPSDVIAKLGLHYTPAIRDGRQILFKGSARAEQLTVPEYLFPILENEMSADLEVDGKWARVRMGLVPEGRVCRETGFIVAFGFRVIAKDQRIGLGDEPTPGLFGWIDLLPGPPHWELSKNKDKIIGLDKLGPAIFQKFRPVIEMATKRSKNIAFYNISKNVNSLLSQILREGLQKGKEKRLKPTNPTGTIPPKNTERKRRTAEKVQLGNTVEQLVKTGKGIQISFEHMDFDGPFWKCQGNIVYLNLDNPALARDQQNERAVTCHAIHAVSTYLVLIGKAKLLSFMRDAEHEHEQISWLAGHLLARLEPMPDVKIAGIG